MDSINCFESEAIENFLKPRSVACLSARRIARASAIIGEQVCVAIEENCLLSPEDRLEKMHPNPAILELTSHVASDWQVMRSKWGSLAGSNERFVSTCPYWIWAICHSWARLIACIRVSWGLSWRFSKICWFRANQNFQRIHGGRGPNPAPVGGKQINPFVCSIPSLNEFIRYGFRRVLKEADCHTCLAAGKEEMKSAFVVTTERTTGKHVDVPQDQVFSHW